METEIARFFETDLFPIQYQLEKLEAGGVIISKKAVRTILYRFNPQYALLKELKLLLDKAICFYPEDLQENLLIKRRCPRRQGKPE
jgi:hypothetical protein